MLAAIGETVVDELAELNFITEIPADTDLFRIRIGAEPFHTGAEIGTPPAQFAMQSNRMSPAGIPMFYGAFYVETARLETFDPEHHAGQILSIGTFRATRALRVLDLADLPDIPSVFEEDGHHRIHPLRFLHAFAHDIVKPIARDGREHIEYVPTQIVTEYFRRVFRDAEDRARFSGNRVERLKVWIFTLSAILAGIAGALYVPQVGIINPGEFSPLNSIELVIWVAVGGRGTLYGAIVGALAVNLAKTYFTGALPELWLFVLGAMFVGVTLLLPRGIAGWLKRGEAV